MHTLECLEYTTTREDLIAKWRRTWPNHCKKCQARGGFDEDDWDVGLHEFVYCSDCLDEQKCPRCGNRFRAKLQVIEAPCPTCQWDWGKNSLDVMPPPWECDCWILEYEAYRGYID